jgi:hypothetical protein
MLFKNIYHCTSTRNSNTKGFTIEDNVIPALNLRSLRRRNQVLKEMIEVDRTPIGRDYSSSDSCILDIFRCSFLWNDF